MRTVPSAERNRHVFQLGAGQAPPPETDEDKLQGDWRVVGGKVDGEEIDVSKGRIAMSFVGDLLTMTGYEGNIRFKLEHSKSPRQLAIATKIGTSEREIGTMIYSLDGDELKLCSFNDEEKKGLVPDDFTSTKGSGRQFFILKRLKPSEQSQPRQSSTGAQM
jgi:uncharacterized protein (TIGR03067 family)